MYSQHRVSEEMINTGWGKTPLTLFGVECEIEAIRSYTPEIEGLWNVHEDGSLRNNGREFTTLPMDRDATINAFKKLHSSLRLGPDPFSSRTSIHVHVNAQNLSFAEVKKFLMLYVLFEEFFFLAVDPARRGNIHCVPLGETLLPNHYSRNIPTLHSVWTKYTAVNLRPLSALGTVEFRHMHGHNDPELLDRWLRLLENMMATAKKMKPFDKDTFTPEAIAPLFKELFQHFPQYPVWVNWLPEKTFNSALDIKLSF